MIKMRNNAKHMRKKGEIYAQNHVLTLIFQGEMCYSKRECGAIFVRTKIREGK